MVEKCVRKIIRPPMKQFNKYKQENFRNMFCPKVFFLGYLYHMGTDLLNKN